MVIVDSGIVLATYLMEPHSEKAKALIQSWQEQGTTLAAPALFRYEVIAVMRRAIFQKRLTAEEASEGCDEILSTPIQFYIDNELLKRAFEIASHFNRPTAYDSQYLAVAERSESEFWTADERLFNAVKNELNWVRWLGNVALPIGK